MELGRSASVQTTSEDRTGQLYRENKQQPTTTFCSSFFLRELRGQGDPGDSAPLPTTIQRLCFGAEAAEPGGAGGLRGCTLQARRDLQDDPPGEPDRPRRHKRCRRGTGKGAALLRRVAVLLLFAGATSALPARAQDPGHCTTALPGELWCATLTVGEDKGDFGVAVGDYGDLDPATFEQNGTRDVDGLYHRTEESPPVLDFETEGDLGNGDGFVLILGSVRLALDDSHYSGNIYRVENPGLSWSDGQKIEVRLIETPTNAAPTASNGSVAMDWNTEYAFQASDFNFSDMDMNDTLTSVKVETLPASGKGRLTLDGAAILSTELPKTVTTAELDANELVYSPPANTYGSAFASFTFKVNDGTEDSASAYTMTINVNLPSGRPVVVNTIPDQTAIVDTAFRFQFAENVFVNPETGSLTYSATRYDRAALPSWLSFAADTRTFSGTPASGDVGRLPVNVRATDGAGAWASDTFDIVVGSKPAISGTARVGETLTAVTGSNGSFTYQWIRVDGMTETDISGETSSTYTLGTADLGKKVKVKVSFTVNGTDTEAKSDAYPPHANVQPATHGTASLTGTAAGLGGHVDGGRQQGRAHDRGLQLRLVERNGRPDRGRHRYRPWHEQLPDRQVRVALRAGRRPGAVVEVSARVPGVQPDRVGRPERLERSDTGVDRGREDGPAVACR